MKINPEKEQLRLEAKNKNKTIKAIKKHNKKQSIANKPKIHKH